jgi:hypothetical protein
VYLEIGEQRRNKMKKKEYLLRVWRGKGNYTPIIVGTNKGKPYYSSGSAERARKSLYKHDNKISKIWVLKKKGKGLEVVE